MMGKISVIVPVYKCEKYIEECIRSILKQGYENFELVLIDDGSPDSSGEICDRFAKEDSRVKVIHQQNTGVAKARQAGIDDATGEYITFIDSDDYIKHDYLQCLYTSMINSKSDVICCNSIDVGIGKYINKIIENDEVIEINLMERIMEDYFGGMRYAYSIWGKLYKKSLFDNLTFLNLKYGEDTCMLLNIFKKCHSISLMQYEGYYYRCQQDGISMNLMTSQKAKDLLVQADIVYDICQKTNDNLFSKAKRQRINSIYALLAGVVSKQDKQEKEILDNCLSGLEDNSLLKESKKGIVLYLYMKCPSTVQYSLKAMYKIRDFYRKSYIRE